MDPVKAGDTELGKILILTDITDSKLAEYAIRTAEKLAATGKLAHAIAHEINNPLEALVNLVYLASSANRVEDIHQFLAQANTEVARISRITKQSLSFHRDTQFAVPLDVGTLMDEVIALYRKLAETRKVGYLRSDANAFDPWVPRTAQPGLRQSPARRHGRPLPRVPT